jgi:hypothetical protein
VERQHPLVGLTHCAHCRWRCGRAGNRLWKLLRGANLASHDFPDPNWISSVATVQARKVVVASLKVNAMDEDQYNNASFGIRVIMLIVFLTTWWLFEPVSSLLWKRAIDPQRWLFYGLHPTVVVILMLAFAPLMSRRPAVGLALVLGIGFVAILGITALLMYIFER